MRSLRRLSQNYSVFILLLSLLFAHSTFGAQITVSVDRNPVSIEESFQIIFTANESPDNDPDFSSLEQDFDIISQSNSSRASWINGKASKSIQWVLTVMAKQAGNLNIPPVKFGKDMSGAETVMVTQEATSTNLNTEEDILLEVEATPEIAYVQSQILYTVRIYTRVEIARASLNEPELADAVIEKLTEDSNYTTRIHDIDYSVTERKYAVFPQKSGFITIKPLILTAEVMTNNRSGFNGFFGSLMTKTKRVSSKAITMEVKPALASFTGQHWLSAEKLVLKETWSGDIHQMKVGEPLTRTLTLLAKGTTVGQLPELNTINADSQVKVYPDQPVLQEQKKPDGLVASREEKIALIPSKSGKYTLPAIEVPWFNTRTHTMETAIIPETTITALAEPGKETEVQAPGLPVATANTSQKIPVIQVEGNHFWIWVSLFLAIGWLATLIFFLTGRSVKKSDLNRDEDDYDYDLRENIKKLKKACVDNDAQAAKNAVIEWGRNKFNAASLGAIASFCDARLRDEILYLSRNLYGKETGSWQGKKLFQAFAENKVRGTLFAQEDSSLEPLYRL